MNNALIDCLRHRAGLDCDLQDVDPVWLLALLSVFRPERFSLRDWSDALSQIGKTSVQFDSYDDVADYVSSAVLV